MKNNISYEENKNKNTTTSKLMNYFNEKFGDNEKMN